MSLFRLQIQVVDTSAFHLNSFAVLLFLFSFRCVSQSILTDFRDILSAICQCRVESGRRGRKKSREFSTKSRKK